MEDAAADDRMYLFVKFERRVKNDTHISGMLETEAQESLPLEEFPSDSEA